MLRIIVVGGTGNVGRKIIEVLSRSSFHSKEIFVVSSSDGTKVPFKKGVLSSIAFDNFSFRKGDLVFLAVSSSLSKDIAPPLCDLGCVIIDNSSYWRMHSNVPLIVPEVNKTSAIQKKEDGKGFIISNPNCSTIPLCLALRNVVPALVVKRVVMSTYQSVSGAGYEAIVQLHKELQDFYQVPKRRNPTKKSPFPCPIAFNVIPRIDSFEKDGRTFEEAKVEVEMRKILNEPSLGVQVMAVRVPTIQCHCASVFVETQKDFSVLDLVDMIKGQGVVVAKKSSTFYSPRECIGSDSTYVCRIRRDHTVDHGFCFWIVSDNLLKGAALNAVQIAESLFS